MIVHLNHSDQSYSCDLSKPIDISIPMGQVRCFYAPEYSKGPHINGNFVGAVEAGASVNFFDININPHGNGTHTECFGHITAKQDLLDDHMNQYHFIGRVISVNLSETDNGDMVITDEELKASGPIDYPEVLIVRTLPNRDEKLYRDYSGMNPPYMTSAAMRFIVAQHVRHLMLDLPSVDREDDGGKLSAHRIFWNMEKSVQTEKDRKDCTITELIYVPNEVKDGLYLVNIQFPPLVLDAAPSRPVLFPLSIDK